jgi:hypothetical protein
MLKYNSNDRITAQNAMHHEFFKDVPQSIKNQGSSTNNRRRMPQPRKELNSDLQAT